MAAEKKATKEAKAALEALSLKHSKCEVTQDLQVKCDEGDKETSRLKLALRQVGEKSKEQEGELADLCTENIWLEWELLKANKSIKLLNENVQIKHEKVFNKAVRQAAYLLGADPSLPGSTSLKMSSTGR